MRIAIHLGLIFGLFGVIPNSDSQESTACRGTNVTGCSSGRIDRDQDTVSDAAARTEAVRIAQARGWSTGGRKSEPDPFTDEVSVSASFTLYAQRSAEWDSGPLLLGAVNCLSDWESEPLELILTTLGSTLGSGNLKYRFDSTTAVTDEWSMPDTSVLRVPNSFAARMAEHSRVIVELELFPEGKKLATFEYRDFSLQGAKDEMASKCRDQMAQ